MLLADNRDYADSRQAFFSIPPRYLLHFNLYNKPHLAFLPLSTKKGMLNAKVLTALFLIQKNNTVNTTAPNLFYHRQSTTPIIQRPRLASLLRSINSYQAACKSYPLYSLSVE